MNKKNVSLKESEEKYRTLVEQASDAIFVTDSNFCFTEVNLSCSLISGYPKEELIGKSIYELLVPEDIVKFPLEIENLKKGKTVINERRIRKKDGTIITAELSSKILSDGRLQSIVRDITLRKQIEEKERILNQRLISVFESMTDGFVSFDNKWNCTYVNKKAGEMFNREPDSLIGKHIWTEFPEGINQPFYKAYFKAVEEQTTVVLEEYYPHLNRWFENRIYPSEAGISIFLHDITERKNAEAVVQQSQEIFSKIFHNSPVPICFTTFEDGKFIEVNSSFLQLIGYEKDEIIGKTSTEIGFYVKPEDLQIFIDEMKEKDQMWGFELPFRKKSGELRESIRYLGSIKYKDQNYLITFLLDITDQKKAEKALRESEEKFSKIFHTSPIPISISTFEDGIFVDVNESFLRLFEYDREEVIGVSSDQLGWFISPFTHSNLLVDLIQKGKIWGIELEFKTKNGELKYSERYIDIITLNNKQYFLVFTIDINERKISNNALRDSEEKLRITNEQLHSLSAHLQNIREEERANLARDIHDELGQLLSAIKIDLGILGQKLSLMENENEGAVFSNDIKSINGFIDDTIKSVRKIISELRPEVLDQLGLVEAIKWYINEYETRFKINCNFITKLEEIKLEKSYAIALFRIVQESLTNITRHSNAKKVTIRLAIKKRQLVLEIKDNGIGFDQNILKNTKRFGLLGMRERVFLMGGEFEVISSPGKGTELITKIPYFQKKKSG